MVGTIAQAGALAAAIFALACCWLPLLLIAFGISGGALAAGFEASRPVLLPLTFALLGLAFYFTYRKPAAAVGGSGKAGTGDDCCTVPGNDAGSESCCTPEKKGFTIRKMNKVMLWPLTALVLAFAFFPNYVGFLLTSGAPPARTASPDLADVRWTLAISGMTCEGCAAHIEANLSKVPGVHQAAVKYEARNAVVSADSSVSEEALRAAVLKAGYTLKSAGRT